MGAGESNGESFDHRNHITLRLPEVIPEPRASNKHWQLSGDDLLKKKKKGGIIKNWKKDCINVKRA